MKDSLFCISDWLEIFQRFEKPLDLSKKKGALLLFKYNLWSNFIYILVSLNTYFLTHQAHFQYRNDQCILAEMPPK